MRCNHDGMHTAPNRSCSDDMEADDYCEDCEPTTCAHCSAPERRCRLDENNNCDECERTAAVLAP